MQVIRNSRRCAALAVVVFGVLCAPAAAGTIVVEPGQTRTDCRDMPTFENRHGVCNEDGTFMYFQTPAGVTGATSWNSVRLQPWHGQAHNMAGGEQLFAEFRPPATVTRNGASTAVAGWTDVTWQPGATFSRNFGDRWGFFFCRSAGSTLCRTGEGTIRNDGYFTTAPASDPKPLRLGALPAPCAADGVTCTPEALRVGLKFIAPVAPGGTTYTFNTANLEAQRVWWQVADPEPPTVGVNVLAPGETGPGDPVAGLAFNSVGTTSTLKTFGKRHGVADTLYLQGTEATDNTAVASHLLKIEELNTDASGTPTTGVRSVVADRSDASAWQQPVGLHDGVYRVRRAATDISGDSDPVTGAATAPNTGTVDETITFDTGAPTARIPADQRSFRTQPTTLRINVRDDQRFQFASGIKPGTVFAFALTTDAAGGETLTPLGTPTGLPTDPKGNGDYTFTLPAPLEEGKHTILVSAKDNALNEVVQTNIGAVWVDSTLPRFSAVTVPYQGESVDGASVSIGTNASDGESGMASGVLYLDGSTTPVAEDADGKVTYAASNLSPGTHSARVVATDNAGNTAEKTWTFTVRQPPADNGTGTGTGTGGGGPADLGGDTSTIVGGDMGGMSGPGDMGGMSGPGDMGGMSGPGDMGGAAGSSGAGGMLEASVRAAKAKLAAVTRGGLRTTIRCSASCRARLTVAIPGSVARKLKLRSKVGAGSVTLGDGGTRQVVLRLAPKAKKQLAKLAKVRLSVRVTVTDANGDKQPLSTSVTVRR